MHWNYRMLRTERKGEAFFQLVEAYYDDGSLLPHSYAEPHAIGGDSPRDIARLLDHCTEALGKPPIFLTEQDDVLEWQGRPEWEDAPPERHLRVVRPTEEE